MKLVYRYLSIVIWYVFILGRYTFNWYISRLCFFYLRFAFVFTVHQSKELASDFLKSNPDPSWPA